MTRKEFSGWFIFTKARNLLILIILVILLSFTSCSTSGGSSFGVSTGAEQLAIAGNTSGSSVQDNTESIQELLNNGHRFANRRNYTAAIEEYSKIIAIDPNHADAYNFRGVAYQNSSDFDNAIADYSEALRIDPNNVDVLNWRGLAYRDKNDIDNAIADFTEALRINPERSNVRALLDDIMQNQRAEQQRAIATAERQRRDAERQAELAVTIEQLRRIVRFDGSYVASGGNWRFLRFVVVNNAPRVSIITNDGRTIGRTLLDVTLEGNEISILHPGGTQKFTVQNNNNFRSQSNNTFSYTFTPFPSLNGKSFSVVNRSSRTTEFGFRERNYAWVSNGVLNSGDEWTYEFQDGELTLLNNGRVINRLTSIGPYLLSGSNELWQMDN